MKTAFVAGASRGIGEAFVQLLSENSYKVFAGSRNPKKSTNSSVTNVQIDVANESSIKKAFEEVARQTDKLDLLINCAGINSDSPGLDRASTTEFGKLKQADILEMISINAVGPILTTQVFAGLLRGGTVVNISSYRASFSHRDSQNHYGSYAYAPSKVALNMMSRDLAHDLAKQNTKVFAIDPGSVRTAMHKTGILEPRDSASKILHALEKLGPEDSGNYFDNEGNPFPL